MDTLFHIFSPWVRLGPLSSPHVRILGHDCFCLCPSLLFFLFSFRIRTIIHSFFLATFVVLLYHS